MWLQAPITCIAKCSPWFQFCVHPWPKPCLPTLLKITLYKEGWRFFFFGMLFCLKGEGWNRRDSHWALDLATRTLLQVYVWNGHKMELVVLNCVLWGKRTTCIEEVCSTEQPGPISSTLFCFGDKTAPGTIVTCGSRFSNGHTHPQEAFWHGRLWSMWKGLLLCSPLSVPSWPSAKPQSHGILQDSHVSASWIFFVKGFCTPFIFPVTVPDESADLPQTKGKIAVPACISTNFWLTLWPHDDSPVLSLPKQKNVHWKWKTFSPLNRSYLKSCWLAQPGPEEGEKL